MLFRAKREETPPNLLFDRSCSGQKQDFRQGKVGKANTEVML